MPGASLRVDAHTDVMRHDGAARRQRVAAGLARLAAAGLIDLHVHDYFTDDELWDYLSSLDVSVLPYRFGTHSGWLEACFDLGTVVLAPDCGYYAEQRPCVTYAVPGTVKRSRRRADADRGAAPGPRGAPGLACGSRRPTRRNDWRSARGPRGHLRRGPGRECRMHVVMIAASRFPLKEPFAGGLESLTWNLCRGLRYRGIQVSVFAGPGSDPRLGVRELATRPLDLSAAARAGRRDAAGRVAERAPRLPAGHARAAAARDVDVIHNNSLHHLPVAMAVACRAPMVTTLHTPPTPWLEPAIEIADDPRSRYVAVSEHTRASWRPRRRLRGGAQRRGRAPVAAGAQAATRCLGRAPGAREGAPPGDRHRRAAGMRLRLAGPVGDADYVRDMVTPAAGAGRRVPRPPAHRRPGDAVRRRAPPRW